MKSLGHNIFSFRLSVARFYVMNLMTNSKFEPFCPLTGHSTWSFNLNGFELKC